MPENNSPDPHRNEDRIVSEATHDEVNPKPEGPIVAPDLPPERTADDVAGPSPEDSFQTLAAGMHVSHYLLQSKIGEGGCGIVFLAQNTDHPNERCALKLIRPDRLKHGKVALRFQQEIQALTGLSHANIVCATESGDWKGISYLVMEYVEGQSLDDIIERRGATETAEACELVRQTAVGLQYLHESKLTHRDIKPSNLILTPEGVVKILDLGLARLMDIDDPEERLTSIGDMMGTPDYMAPEQWKDASNVDIRGDIYSLGCTLYCLLTGSAPYSAQKSGNPMSLMKAHSKSPIPDIQKLNGDVPQELSELIQCCLGKRPDERPETPQVLVEKLTKFTVDASLPALLGSVASDSGLPATSGTHVEHVDEKGTIDEDAADCSTDGGPGNSSITEPVASPLVGVKSTLNEDTDQLNAQQSENIIPVGVEIIPVGVEEETHIEVAKSTFIPIQVETLIDRKDELEGTLAEQTIKPQIPTASPVTPGSGQRNAARGSVGSFTTFSSVVVRQREVTFGVVENRDAVEYEIGRKLGEGGMGAVFQARQGSIDRTVALKMVKGQRIPQSMQEAFLAEAVVTGALEHPNIVPIYDLGANPGGELFYAMKEVRGQPWKDTIDQVGDETNLDVLMKVTDAIAFAHSRGVVHRDLKPDNVMIGEFGEVIVMDWGLAFPTSEFDRPGLTVTKGVAGTPSYMSPEMAESKTELIGPKSDVYLLGGQLFRAITGGPPHTGKHAYAALHAAAENEIAWPEDTATVNSELLAIARKAMETAPQDRYESAIDFQQALRDYRSHSESRRLTEFALNELEAGEASGEYRRFEKAIVGLEEAIQLWPENDRAIEALKLARMSYAQTAFNRRDFELAESQLDDDDDTHRELLTQIRLARADRDAQSLRMRRLKQMAAALAVVVFLTVSVSAIWINNAHQKEIVARTEAVDRFKESQASIRELSELADALSEYPLAQTQRRQLLEAVSHHYERQTNELSDVPELRLEQLRSLVRLGDVQNQLAEYSKALVTWDRAGLFVPPDTDSLQSEELVLLNAHTEQGRGNSLAAQGKLNDAELAAARAVSKLTDYLSTVNSDRVRRELGFSLLHQADVIQRSLNPDTAERQVELAIEHFEKLKTPSGDVGLASADSLRAQLRERNGQFEMAAASVDRAIKTWLALSKSSPDNLTYYDGLATSQIDRANVLRAAGHDPVEDYSDAAESFQRLVELRPGIPRYRFNLATALAGLAWTQNRRGQSEAAQETAVDSVNAFLFLSKRYAEDSRFALGHVSSRLVLAAVLRDRGDFDLAVGVTEEAHEVLVSEPVQLEFPEARERIGELLILYGQLQAEIGEHDLAKQLLQQAAEEMTTLAGEEAGLPSHQDAAAWANFYLAQELAESGEAAAAQAALDTAIGIREQLAERATWMDSHAWFLLYAPVETSRDSAIAETLAGKAVMLAKGSPRLRRTLALAQLREGKIAAAAETLAHSRRLMKHPHPEQDFLESLVAAYQKREGDAVSLFSTAAKLMDEIAPANPRLLMIRQEAATEIGEDGSLRQEIPDAPAAAAN